MIDEQLWDPRTLGWIFQAIQTPPRPEWMPYAVTAALECGWALNHQIGDLGDDLGWPAMTRSPAMAAAGVAFETVYHRPKSKETMKFGYQGLRAADLAALMIFIERLGFAVDPQPLVSALLPGLKNQAHLSQSDLRVFWYARERHRCEPVSLRAADGRHDRIEQFKTEAGYHAVLRSSGGEAVQLDVDAPKFRRLRAA